MSIKHKNNNGYRLKQTRAVLTILCMMFFSTIPIQPLFGQDPPDAGTAVQTLAEIKLGTLPEFSRLVFTFSRPVDAYTIKRWDVDQLLLDFGSAQAERLGRVNLKNDLISGISSSRTEQGLEVRIKTTNPRFNFRNFTSPDGLSVVVDIRPVIPMAPQTTPQGEPKTTDLTIPSAKEVAARLRGLMPFSPQPGTDEALVAEAADLIAKGKYAEAIPQLELFRTKHVYSYLRDPGLFLLGDAYYALDPENFADHFLKITDAYQNALGLYPNSKEAPRARLMLARSYQRMDFISEAVGYYKGVIEDFPKSKYAALAHVFLGELYLKLEKIELAKAAFDAALSFHPKGRLFTERFYKLGEAYFKEGLFSQSTEVFKTILDRDPWYYQEYPDILYYMGEGYFHLDRQDLSRVFLFHSLNIDPEQKDADVIMARIGDTLMDEQRFEEAVNVYTLTRELYPQSPGSLVSQMRLADYGALRSLFPAESIFQELENGVQNTVLNIYRQIMETDQESPLVQLAMFKLAQTYLKQNDNPSAVNVFKTLLEKFPKTELKPEIQNQAEKAVYDELKVLYALQDYQSLINYYRDNKNYVSKENWPEIRHYLGLAHAALNQHQETIQLLEANKGLTNMEDDRMIELADSYQTLGRYTDAAATLDQFRKDFPDHPQVGRSYLDQAKAELAQGLDHSALSHLEQAIKTNPALSNDGQIQAMLGQLYLKKSDYQNGAAALEKAVAHKVQNKGYPEEIFNDYSQLGQAYAHLGKTEEAVQALDTALEYAPKKPAPETLYLISQTYKDLGKQEKYKAVLDRMVRLPDKFWRDVADQELQSLNPDKKLTQLLESEEEGE